MSPTKKIPVGILGATGSVGQKFVELLHGHPWFEITALAASERSSGKTYAEAAHWFQSSALPERIGNMVVSECVPTLPCRIVFSGLDASVAGEIEESFAKAGYAVVSNSKNHRWDANVPLLIPEVNPDHLELVRAQAFGGGMIVTNPNCSAVGLTMALKPLHDAFGLADVSVVTMQAISGAGYPGVSALDILDNVIPFIGGEEEKLEREPLRILGDRGLGAVTPAAFRLSAQCNRVAVIDGHTECVAVRLKRKAAFEEVVAAWRSFRSVPQELSLPTAPVASILYHDGETSPQPKLHRGLGNGMAVSVGRLRPDAIFDWKFVVLSHNTVRGAAGGAILNAELMVSQKFL